NIENFLEGKSLLVTRAGEHRNL
ncbi:hypothetical protein ACMD2_14310, partial [Ananas comosus]